MSDLRWSDCDELAASNPIACLLCRTGKLNDAAHDTERRLGSIEVELNTAGKSRNRWGIAAAAGGIIGVGFQIGLAVFKAAHGG